MNKLSAGTRIGAMILDHFVMTFVVMIFAAPGMVFDLVQTFGNTDAQPKLFPGNFYLNIFAFSLYFNKDIFCGRSIAKRVLKLQVVDRRTNKPASPLRCLVRNLTVLLWPIEVVVALINTERRIGDFIAGTKLTAFDPEQHQEQVNWPLVIVAALISMLVTYWAVFYPVELAFNDTGLVTH